MKGDIMKKVVSIWFLLFFSNNVYADTCLEVSKEVVRRFGYNELRCNNSESKCNLDLSNPNSPEVEIFHKGPHGHFILRAGARKPFGTSLNSNWTVTTKEIEPHEPSLSFPREGESKATYYFMSKDDKCVLDFVKVEHSFNGGSNIGASLTVEKCLEYKKEKVTIKNPDALGKYGYKGYLCKDIEKYFRTTESVEPKVKAKSTESKGMK